ncbi:hypothetical protein PIB30_064573 [Stylosanthes scabra]|uniref:RNase H type-1 domain-containing protein n=1 Tax=Stylosanthes scabra TaxID=79078 RepID=A0ABU6TLI2_9FABA|nr:hypothetical protein [Stylosanthes scabra]
MNYRSSLPVNLYIIIDYDIPVCKTASLIVPRNHQRQKATVSKWGTAPTAPFFKLNFDATLSPAEDGNAGAGVVISDGDELISIVAAWRLDSNRSRWRDKEIFEQPYTKPNNAVAVSMIQEDERKTKEAFQKNGLFNGQKAFSRISNSWKPPSIG